MAYYRGGFEFPDYVSVAQRRARARKAAEKIARKHGRALAPVGPIEGNKLVRTFWGKAWCENLESYGDYVNRLPRGRSYARHGAVIDLQIANGKVSALVSEFVLSITAACGMATTPSLTDRCGGCGTSETVPTATRTIPAWGVESARSFRSC